MNVSTSAAVSIYIPCLREMAIDLGTTSSMLQISIITHLVGEFLGRFICGPLIDTYGIRRIIIPSITFSVVGYLGCFLSSTISIFLVMRFVQAIGASVIYIASVSIINTEFSGKEKSGIIGVLELYQPIAWILSPFVGSILSEIGSWRLLFLILMISHLIGLFVLFFYDGNKEEDEIKKGRKISVSKIVCDYGVVIKNSYFLIYALIPGLFAGGYMIFATNAPFICSEISCDNSTYVAIFQSIPLVFYILATFVYRAIVQNFSIKLAKKIGVVVYIIFGIYMSLLIVKHVPWTSDNLLALMCVQCFGSAFLVPVSVLKALQSSGKTSCVGASTVVVFRNIIMSLCIGLTAKFNEDITIIMGAVFMTVASAIVLFTARRIIKMRLLRKQGL